MRATTFEVCFIEVRTWSQIALLRSALQAQSHLGVEQVGWKLGSWRWGWGEPWMIQLSSGLLLQHSPNSEVPVVYWSELGPGTQCHLCRSPGGVPPLVPTTSCSRLCRKREGGLLRTLMPRVSFLSSSDQH